MSNDALWQIRHRLRISAQFEWRPGEGDWVEHRATGLVMAWCPCGYTSGWVAKDALPPVEELRTEHPIPTLDDPMGTGRAAPPLIDPLDLSEQTEGDDDQGERDNCELCGGYTRLNRWRLCHGCAAGV
ncbi:hypothetical protein [Actinocorallia aurantiaca]|uniref:Uncharacterized protein n=1 Tax=Actinocorallia aurantiaca TaxID=46204 RepID=A0ABP6H8L7_9ACTN